MYVMNKNLNILIQHLLFNNTTDNNSLKIRAIVPSPYDGLKFEILFQIQI